MNCTKMLVALLTLVPSRNDHVVWSLIFLHFKSQKKIMCPSAFFLISWIITTVTTVALLIIIIVSVHTHTTTVHYFCTCWFRNTTTTLLHWRWCRCCRRCWGQPKQCQWVAPRKDSPTLASSQSCPAADASLQRRSYQCLPLPTRGGISYGKIQRNKKYQKCLV